MSASLFQRHLKFHEPQSPGALPESVVPMFQERQAGQNCFRVLSLPCAVAQPRLAVRPCCAFSSRKGSLSPAGPAPLLAPAGTFSVLGGRSPLGPGRRLLCSRWWQRPPSWPASSFHPWSHQLFFKTSVYLPKVWCLPYQQNESRLPNSLAGHSEYFVSGPSPPFPFCPSLSSFTLSLRPFSSMCSAPTRASSCCSHLLSVPCLLSGPATLASLLTLFSGSSR